MERSWFQQYALLLLTLCKLKRWRFLLLLVPLASAFSNHFLYTIVKSGMSSIKRTNFEPIGPREFAKENFILGDWDQFAGKKANIEEYYFSQDASAESMFESCGTDETCERALFHTLFRLSGKSSSLLRYSAAGGPPEIRCQTSPGEELQCALLGSLVLMAEVNSTHRLQRFNTVKMFQVVMDSRRDHRQLAPDTTCASELHFSRVMPHTVMLQSLLLLSSVVLYLLASTATCIVDLKGSGFLQLLFRRGLSVLAYWLALWTVTLLELLLIAAALVLSLHLQCPGFYSPGSLAQVLAALLGQLTWLTSAVLLLTIAIRDFFHTGVAAMLLTVLCSALVVLLRTAVSSSLRHLEWLRLPTLVLPPGHLAEQVQAHLLNSPTSYHRTALVLSYASTAALTGLTLYLDFVLPAGNGFRLPLFYLFMPDFWTAPGRQDLQLGDVQQEQNPGVEEELDESLVPAVRVLELVKEYGAPVCGQEKLQSGRPAISIHAVTMYRSQITAVVGHSQSGKTALLNILAAIERPSGGLASVDDISLGSPMAAIHALGRIGVCPQSDALSHGLTVADSLDLLLASCGRRRDSSSEPQAQRLLSALRLREKQPARVGAINPGQRRKLCLALALLGGPQTVVLDEPTSGVDPFSRRRIWRLLQEFKEGRCVVLSTQRLDEAEALVDRTLCLAGGTVVCAGSTPFLKRLLDCGFVFQVAFGTERHAGLFLHDLQSKFGRVRARKVHRSRFELQVSAEDSHLLLAVADELEKRSGHIEQLALTQASLDEAFARLLKRRTLEGVKGSFTTGGTGCVLDDDDDSDGLDSNQQQAEELRTSSTMEPRTSSTKEPRTSSTKEPRTSSTMEPRTSSTMEPTAGLKVSHWQSACLYAGIMRLRLLRNTPRLINRLVAAAVLLAVLLVSAVLERLLKNDQLEVHIQISNATYMSIDSAYCLWNDDAIYGGSNAFHSPVTSRFCIAAMNHRNSTSGTSAMTGIRGKGKSQGEEFLEFYQKNPTSVVELMAHCLEAEKCTVPYPVAYISNICNCPMEYNRLRDIYIGAVIGSDHYSAPAMAHSAVGVLQRLFYYYITHLKSVPVDPRLRVSAIYDYRTMLIPTFGAFLQLIVITVVPAICIDDVIEDKETRARHAMSNMGMSLLGYWAAICFVHWLQIAVLYLLSVIVMICAVPSGYLSAYYIVGIALPTLLLGITNNQLLVYLISTFSERPSPQIVTGYRFFCVVNALSLLGAQLNHYAGIVLIMVVPPFATIAPTFYGTKAIFYALSYHRVRSMSQVPHKSQLYGTQQHMVHSLVAMVLHKAILCGLIAASEKRHRMLRRFRRQRSGPQVADSQQSDDPGVLKELERIDASVMSDANVLEVRHLRKYHPQGSRAVRDLTFGVMSGEILGLIGPNGAGKTTTLAAVVGELVECSGSCAVRSRHGWLPSHLTVGSGAVGYCPQHNPLFEQVTVLEHLLFYARLLGLGPLDDKARADQLIRATGLAGTEDARACDLPCGRRRLLTLAISMLGDPALLVVDEASTGVDSGSRRALWAAIKSYARYGRSIVLATNSVDEAEALCDRIGIVNHGLMVCLGSGPRLMELYGGYYTLDIEMDPARGAVGSLARSLRERMIKSVMAQIPAAQLVDSFTARVLFSMPVDSRRRPSTVLKWLFDNRAQLHVESFTYRQVSLDCILDAVLKKHDSQMQTQGSSPQCSIFSTNSSSSPAHATVSGVEGAEEEQDTSSSSEAKRRPG